MMFLYIKPFGLFSKDNPIRDYLLIKSSSHLLSHTVSSIVPSAAYVLTIVFGMRTGVPRKRIATGIASPSLRSGPAQTNRSFA